MLRGCFVGRRRWALGFFVLTAALGAAALTYRSAGADAAADSSAVGSAVASDAKPATGGQAPTSDGRRMIPGAASLETAVRWAEESLDDVRKIRDYTCTLVKRERVGDRLLAPQSMILKVRQQPYSVYVRYLSPQSLHNQEAIYVEGRNDGKLLAHSTGMRHRLLGTLALKPTSPLAMRGNRHPITEVGLAVLVEKLAVLGRHDLEHGSPAEVTFERSVLLGGRPCTVIEVRHPRQTPGVDYHLARIFVDEQWVLPVRFEAYDWPSAPGEQPPLLEEYTYVDLQLNCGFTAADFDTSNPHYGFTRGTAPEIQATAQSR